MATTLFVEMWICQEYKRHHIGAGDPSLHPGLAGAQDIYQRETALMGGCCQSEPLPIKSWENLQQENLCTEMKSLFRKFAARKKSETRPHAFRLPLDPKQAIYDGIPEVPWWLTRRLLIQ